MPKVQRGRGLKRTYAMDNIEMPEIWGKYERQAREVEYEPATEHESESNISESCDVIGDDDDTPKKKKIIKMALRDAVGAIRQHPEQEKAVSHSDCFRCT